MKVDGFFLSQKVHIITLVRHVLQKNLKTIININDF